MKALYDRRAILEQWQQRIAGRKCRGCGGPLTARLVGTDRLDIIAICEAQTCWPKLPRTWRKEQFIIGFAREYGARQRA